VIGNLSAWMSARAIAVGRRSRTELPLETRASRPKQASLRT
jgi:hypothetical protein